MRRETRSWLFVPGDDEHKIAKVARAGADAVILDLEDAVAGSRRPMARELLAEYLESPDPDGESATETWVRINPLDTADALPDLAAVVTGRLAGIVLPKPRRGSDVTQLCHYLSALEARAGLHAGSVEIMVVATETPEMMFRLEELGGSSPRLRACTWGAEDLATALGAATNKGEDGDFDTPYQLARSLCLFAAGAAGVQAVDTLYGSFRDDEGLLASTRRALRQGFTGKLAIHPRQVPVINQALTPSADDVAEAVAVIDAFASQPHAGAVSLDGRMLDRPHLLQAERMVARAARRSR